MINHYSKGNYNILKNKEFLETGRKKGIAFCEIPSTLPQLLVGGILQNSAQCSAEMHKNFKLEAPSQAAFH